MTMEITHPEVAPVPSTGASADDIQTADWNAPHDMSTTEMDTTKVLSPDGAGGVEFRAENVAPQAEALLTAEMNAALVLAPDGAGGVEFRAEAGGGGSGVAEDLTTAEMNAALVLAPDGAGGVEFRAETGGGGGGSVNWDPNHAPASPSADDDEFDDLSIDAAWTQTSSGGGSSGTISETERKGFVFMPVQDGGAGAGRGMWKPYTPGSGAITVVSRHFGNTAGAGSNQCSMSLLTSAGVFIWGIGRINGNQIIVSYNGGWNVYTVAGVTFNVGELYMMLRRDAGTGYDALVSNDGFTWTRVTGRTIASVTIGRVSLDVSAFSASYTEAYWDFIRMFPANPEYNIGGAP